MTSYAESLQARDFNCVISASITAKQVDPDWFKELADRAASMVETASGMRSGKALKIDTKLYYLVLW